ncbi:MAG: O-antigen ligase family protein [Elusimicrobia bacterium]|nr:O-antigen ligase family protein [Elusimicrobiota bacterium]
MAYLMEKMHSISSQNKFSSIIVVLAGILFFLIPIVPDEKITRWKLWLLETGLFSIIILWTTNKLFYDKINIKISQLNKPVFVWFVFVVFMYLVSKNKHVAELELYRVIVSAASFFLFSNLYDNKQNRNTVIIFWVIGGFLAAIYGIMTHYGGFWIVRTPQVDRIFSTFGNPIFFAAFLVVTIPLSVYRLIQEREPSYKVLWFFILISFLVALYFTKTRASWIAFIVSCIVFIFLSLDSKAKKIILIFILVIFGFLFTLKTKNIWMRQQGHLVIWRDSLRMLFDKPVLGVGLGSFHISFPDYASEELKKIWPQAQNIVNDAHSEFVQILAETGVVGFGIFMWILFSVFHHAHQFYKRLHDREEFLMYTALFSSAIGLLVQNFFSVDMRFTISSFYLFSVFGMISSHSTVKTKEIKLQNPEKIFTMLALLSAVIFLEYKMVIKQYRSWKIVFESKDFLDKRIINSADQKKEILKMLAANPSDARLYFKLGYLFASEIKVNKTSANLAIENFTKAALLDPKVENGGAFNNIGNIYFTLGDRKSAKENYIKAININPSLIDARLNLGIAYYYEGKLKESSEEFEKVLELDPKNSSAIYMLKKMRE